MMQHAQIGELRRLAEQDSLVAETAMSRTYSPRDRHDFYGFVRDYADGLGVPFQEQEVGYWESLRLLAGGAWSELRGSKHTGLEKASNVMNCTAGALLTASPFYLLTGGARLLLDDQPGEVTVITPRYEGVLLPCTTHEYLHAYHRLMALDFQERGLVEDGWFNLGPRLNSFTPSYTVITPSHRKLKKFERVVIREMIAAEGTPGQ